MSKEKGKPIGDKDLDSIKFGKMRNMIKIEVTLINGEPLRTNITEILAHTIVRAGILLFK